MTDLTTKQKSITIWSCDNIVSSIVDMCELPNVIPDNYEIKRIDNHYISAGNSFPETSFYMLCITTNARLTIYNYKQMIQNALTKCQFVFVIIVCRKMLFDGKNLTDKLILEHWNKLKKEISVSNDCIEIMSFDRNPTNYQKEYIIQKLM